MIPVQEEEPFMTLKEAYEIQRKENLHWNFVESSQQACENPYYFSLWLISEL